MPPTSPTSSRPATKMVTQGSDGTTEDDRRNRLIFLLGRLLARDWLHTRQQRGSAPASAAPEIRNSPLEDY